MERIKILIAMVFLEIYTHGMDNIGMDVEIIVARMVLRLVLNFIPFSSKLGVLIEDLEMS